MLPNLFTSVCIEVRRIQELTNLILWPSDSERDHKLRKDNDSEGFSRAPFIRL
jgi:hypothetical protein